MVPVELARIIINESTDEQVIFLREPTGRIFSIVIGIFEAAHIDRLVRCRRSKRPLTHELLLQVVGALGGDLRHVSIESVQGTTYYATLAIEQGGEILRVDARPSDAIALALQNDVPIYVAASVLDAVARPEV